MAHESIHELTAAYALDALDDDERQRFEEHLASCEPCRGEVASLSEAATSLAYAVEPAAPPPALRSRILQAAHAERENVLPLVRRRPVQILGALTAVAAAAAIALAVWATSLSSRLDRQRDISASRATILQIATEPGSRRLALAGRRGSLVVAPDGRAALVVGNLPAAPSGRTYEAWVIDAGKPLPAGLFHGGGATAAALMRPVPRGAVVGVTVERSGGASAPTRAPIIQVQA